MANFVNGLSNQMNVMKHFIDAETFCCAPNDIAVEQYQKDSLCGNVAARFLSIVQVIVSIAVIPLALVAMIFLPPIFLCTHDKETARSVMKVCGSMMAGHLFRIPEGLIGAIFPSIFTRSPEGQIAQFSQQLQPLGQMFNQFRQPAAQFNAPQMPQQFPQGNFPSFMPGFQGGMNFGRGTPGFGGFNPESFFG